MSASNANGVLILVAGPSGAGKDTLLNAARGQLRHDPRFTFPKRSITRQDNSAEDHIIVGEANFETLRRNGGFFLSWSAHGLHYGIPVSVLDDLNAGRTVVVNVSRRHVAEARAKWARTEVVLIAVQPDVLRQRLVARGRESAREIEDRVRRATDEACAVQGSVHVVDNSKTLEESAAEFTNLLVSLTASVAVPHEVVTA